MKTTDDYIRQHWPKKLSEDCTSKGFKETGRDCLERKYINPISAYLCESCQMFQKLENEALSTS